ncbi:hypothetical protein L484_014603 [Morus notabilis]|uniref:F-box protein n=1 Tax=Morus notabilis TaxID=981085 RepID=W9R6K8_9ROSA|nr:F-box protein At5g07610 [Morus notabilis]EXB59108.1 hypothetical protein L484_014603 [Morus notabilis]
MEQDRGRRGPQRIVNRNNKIYLELSDIIREDALKFLPAKSLYRFQGVCREWRRKIVSPFFTHSQSNTFCDISGFFLQSGSKPPSFISLDKNAYGVPDPSLSFLPEPVDIRASSNGLVCCRGCRGDKRYYICNPVTKRWKELPKPNCDHGSDPAVVLIFEPSLLNFAAEYKLICAFPSVNFGEGYEFEMYTSHDGTWKYLDEIYFGSIKLLPMSGVYVNGSIYWKGTHGELLLFDLTIERTRVLYCLCHTLGVMDEKLCSTGIRYQALTVSEFSNAYTNTMLMNSGARTWEEKHHINLGPSFLPSGGRAGDINRAGNVLFASGNWVLFKNGVQLCAYDMTTKEVKRLRDEVELDIRIASYVNSLVEI